MQVRSDRRRQQAYNRAPTDNLAADGYVVRVADSREKALTVLVTVPPIDVAVIDVNGQTLDLLDAVRAGDGLAGRIDPSVPLVVLTSRVDELHRIRLLDHGGDDVLAKPYSYPELRARIAALLRRADARWTSQQLRAGMLTIDVVARVVRVGEQRQPDQRRVGLMRVIARILGSRWPTAPRGGRALEHVRGLVAPRGDDTNGPRSRHPATRGGVAV